MDLKEIKELIKIIDESELTTLELEREGFRILLKKEERIFSREVSQAVPYAPASPSALPVPSVPTASGRETENAGLPGQQTIDSPIVGTFYSAPAPDENPFVHPGSSVKQGDTLCIIEAMKLMNDIEAEENLQILDVLVKDGEMVEYGQPLFAVKQV